MQLRSHQAQFATVIDRIIDGSDTRRIIVHAVPGAGKSSLPVIAGRLIKAGLADKLAWICPRTSLQDQGERNFLDRDFRELLDHNLAIRSSTNEVSPCRSQDGFISTYQALSVDDHKTVLHEIERRRYVLVLDEFHHVSACDSEWQKTLEPIVERAKYLILMTGTLSRGDDKPIAWVDYENSLPQLVGVSGTEVIRYSRTDALRERAILPIRFILSDGHVEWETNTGKRKEGKLSHRVKDAGEALFTALNTEFADNLLKEGVRHWREYRSNHPRSKLMVVTATYEHAKRHTELLKGMGIKAKIATSHESVEALRNIKEFKFGSLDVLVVIMIGYEGLDCPPLTHIVCLTHIRSYPWIDQCIGRAVRVDRLAGPYRSQMAYVFAPDDWLFRQVVEQIRAEQLPMAHEAMTEGEDGGGNGNGEKRPGINPLAGEITGTREVSLGDIPGGFIPDPVQTVKEQEEEALHKIEMHVRKFSFDNRYKPQRISFEIKQQFGKSRRLMTLDELKSCLRWVRRMYPIEARSPEFLPDGVSRTRGCRERVPTKAQPWCHYLEGSDGMPIKR